MFEPTETERLVRDTARRFVQSTLAPRAADIDAHQQVPPHVYEEMAGLGLMAVNGPPAYGGSGAGTVAYSLALTEVARGCASTAVTMAVTNMVGEVVAAFGTDAQKRRWLPALSGGAYPGAFALSEAGAGSDAGALATTATRDGNGWRIHGTKQWISHADTAGLWIVWARTGGPGTRGISCFLVDPSRPGIEIGRYEDKMGLRGSHTCAMTLDRVRVGPEALLGELNDGFRVAMMALDGGRIGIASQAVGIAEAAHEASLRYARERRQFGAPTADFQAVQWMLADNTVDLEAARLLTLRAAWRKDRGGSFSREASMAKVFASEAAWRVCNRAVQIHGGYGYTREFSVERHLRDVRVTQIYEGTSEIQRWVIARHLLREI